MHGRYARDPGRSVTVVARKRSLRAALLTVTALVALTLTAVPSNATFAKKYDLTVSPSSVASGATGVFSATYKNVSLYSWARWSSRSRRDSRR